MKKHTALRLSVFVLLSVLMTVLAVSGASAQGRTTRQPGSGSASLIGSRGTDTIEDGSFEAGIGSGNWVETSTNFGSPLCTVALCGNGGSTALPRTGDVWAWFGGAGGAGEEGTVSQQLTISAGSTATLEFYLWTGSFDAAGTDTFEVTLGGDPVFSTDETDVTYQTEYTLVSVDLSEWADGTERTLEFYGSDLDGDNTNFSLDDISLTVEAGTDTNLVDNGGFEATDAALAPRAAVLAPWVVKNGTGDKIKVNKVDKIFSHTGEAAFRFKGGAGEKSKLQQNVDLAELTFATGDVIDTSLFVNASNAAASGKVKVVIGYSDSADKTKGTATIAATTDYEELALDSLTLTSGNVNKIKVQIKHTSPAGKVYIDDVVMTQSAAPVLLPLP